MSKVLIIEDEASTRKFLRRVIAPMGHDLTEAVDGQEALAAIGKVTFDLILSDLMVPGEPSGMEMIRQIHTMATGCPIVVVSGYPSDITLAECNELGIMDFLSKPFELTFVQSLVQRVLGTK